MLDFRSRLARIRDHTFAIIGGGYVEEGSSTWIKLHVIM